MATTNYWLQPDRQLDIRGTILFSDNTTKSLTGADIIRYEINEQNALDGFVLGGTVSGAYTLVLDNAEHTIDPTAWYGAKVTMEIGILGANDTWSWEPFGIWFPAECDVQEQSTEAVITGFDAIETYFQRPFEYSVLSGLSVQSTRDVSLVDITQFTTFHELSRPDILNAICTQCNCTVHSSASSNGLSPWREDYNTFVHFSDDVSYRHIIGAAAASICGFAYIDYENKLHIQPYKKTTSPALTLSPSTYITFVQTDVGSFTFKGVQCSGKFWEFAGDFSDSTNVWYEYDITKMTPKTPSSWQTTVRDTLVLKGFFGNLLNTNRPNYRHYSPSSTNNSITSYGAECTFQGDVRLNIGDTIRIVDKKNIHHDIVITSMKTTYDGGLSMEVGCTLPKSLDKSSRVYDAQSTDSNTYSKITMHPDQDFALDTWYNI